jgi:hypothetical protein
VSPGGQPPGQKQRKSRFLQWNGHGEPVWSHVISIAYEENSLLRGTMEFLPPINEFDPADQSKNNRISCGP